MLLNAKSTYVSVSASGSLRRWPVGDAVPGPRIEAEELRADPVVLEAGGGPAVLAALSVKGEQLAREDPRQRRLLVGTVVHAGGSLAANVEEKEMRG